MKAFEIPKNSPFKAWDQPKTISLSVDQIIEMYENGFAGAICSEEAAEDLLSICSIGSSDEVCRKYGFEDASKAKLTLGYLAIEEFYGDDSTWQGPPQGRGNCVERSAVTSCLQSLCNEVKLALPDQVSGKLEGLPVTSPKRKIDGPLAHEPGYWFRGHGGDGWYCAASVKVRLTKCGVIPRVNIEGLADFTSYDEKLAGRFGARAPGQDIVDKLNDNLFRDSTRIDSFESLRDLLGRGFGVTSCGSEGFSSERDENGVSKRSGSWAHALSYIGCDDRTEIIAIYKEPLVLIINSWGLKWNKGPRKIYGTNINIPEGAFWARWSDIKNRDAFAIAGLNGWPRKELPDLEDLSPGAV